MIDMREAAVSWAGLIELFYRIILLEPDGSCDATRNVVLPVGVPSTFKLCRGKLTSGYLGKPR